MRVITLIIMMAVFFVIAFASEIVGGAGAIAEGSRTRSGSRSSSHRGAKAAANSRLFLVIATERSRE